MKSRIQLLLGIAVVAALVVLGVVLWVDRMTPVTITIATPANESVRVSVSGEVRNPGVVEVSADARLLDVVEAAGGFTDDADTDQLNLAGRVGDGEQVAIPAISTTETVGQETTGSGPLLDLNTASRAQLEELPGIGEVLAGRIVDYRQQNGPFTSVDELAEIEGISDGLVEDLRPLVSVGP